jgi:hypothetical protein
MVHTLALTLRVLQVQKSLLLNSGSVSLRPHGCRALQSSASAWRLCAFLSTRSCRFSSLALALRRFATAGPGTTLRSSSGSVCRLSYVALQVAQPDVLQELLIALDVGHSGLFVLARHDYCVTGQMLLDM